MRYSTQFYGNYLIWSPLLESQSSFIKAIWIKFFFFFIGFSGNIRTDTVGLILSDLSLLNKNNEAVTCDCDIDWEAESFLNAFANGDITFWKSDLIFFFSKTFLFLLHPHSSDFACFPTSGAWLSNCSYTEMCSQTQILHSSVFSYLECVHM